MRHGLTMTAREMDRLVEKRDALADELLAMANGGRLDSIRFRDTYTEYQHVCEAIRNVTNYGTVTEDDATPEDASKPDAVTVGQSYKMSVLWTNGNADHSTINRCEMMVKLAVYRQSINRRSGEFTIDDAMGQIDNGNTFTVEFNTFAVTFASDGNGRDVKPEDVNASGASIASVDNGARRLTIKTVKGVLATVGVGVRKKDGEFRVKRTGDAEANAYYTDDLEDALRAGLTMGRPV